jgi:hypothetical protein
VVHIPHYYIRKYRIREPEALYSAVRNGGSTLEGYYKNRNLVYPSVNFSSTERERAFTM